MFSPLFELKASSLCKNTPLFEFHFIRSMPYKSKILRLSKFLEPKHRPTLRQSARRATASGDPVELELGPQPLHQLSTLPEHILMIDNVYYL
jgi:hypothetical protein